MSDYVIANILSSVVVVSMMSSVLMFLGTAMMAEGIKHIGRWFLLSAVLMGVGLFLIPVVDRFWIASQL